MFFGFHTAARPDPNQDLQRFITRHDLMATSVMLVTETPSVNWTGT